MLGAICERLKQNAVVGYLLTGLLLGPAVFNYIQNVEKIRALSEIGVSLLLFTIGLEFSWRRLRELGAVAILGGTLQVVVTIAGASLVSMAFGLSVTESVVVGAVVAMSSTAVVLRVLTSRAEIDSLQGRNALGILLLQDIAVIPVLLILTAMSERTGGWTALRGFILNLVQGGALVAGMYIFVRHLLPRLVNAASAFRNRDLPILLAVSLSIGGAWASGSLGLSPALGAFVAGMLIAGTPFAHQIRADVVPFRAAFVTLFFASVGTIVKLPPAGEVLPLAGLVLAIQIGKVAVVTAIILLFRQPLRVAISTGMALAQIGEFSFVVAELGRAKGLVGEGLFQLLLAATVMTLLLTPYVIDTAPKVTGFLVTLFNKLGAPVSPEPAKAPPAGFARGRVIVVGYGPAGQRATAALETAGVRFLVIDLNPKSVEAFRATIPIQFGDATKPEILEHAHPELAKAVLVTIPDPPTAALIVSQVRRAAPNTPVIARSRYHIYSERLVEAGAHKFVDEEELVGERLGTELLAMLADHRHAVTG